ncbi:hypothetical protein KI387_001649, partial [Taxus chinensis]
MIIGSAIQQMKRDLLDDVFDMLSKASFEAGSLAYLFDLVAKLPHVSCSETCTISTTTVIPSSSENFQIFAAKAYSSVLAAEESLSCKTEVISLQQKVIVDATMVRAMLLKSEEAGTSAATEESVALAKTAVNAAKDAAATWEEIQSLPQTKCLSNEDFLRHKRDRLAQMEMHEIIELFNDTEPAEWDSGAQCKLIRETYFTHHPQHERECPHLSKSKVNSMQSSQNKDGQTARSRRKLRARTRRARILEKTAAICRETLSVASTKISMNNIATSVDFSDPLYLDSQMATTSYLNDREAKLCEGLKDLAKLEKIRARVEIKIGQKPTLEQWAEAVDLDRGTLHRKLLAGKYCRDQIVKGAIRLVVSIARMYRGRGISLPDLIQDGCIGLIRGAEKYDYKRGFKFSTYVYWWIRQAITDAITKRSRTIRLPGYLIDTFFRIRATKMHLYQKFGRPPSDEEIAHLLDLPISRIRFVKRCSKFPRSINQQIAQDNDNTLGELIADPGVKSPETAVTRRLLQQDIDKLLETLQPREKEV